MNLKVRKAVFPVAGLGTRFLPVTKALAKEMLPVIDKPLIQYAAEEAIAAGITELIFITSRSKRVIEDHFDRSIDLEAELERAQKHQLLKLVRNLVPPEVSCVYIRQAEALGLGHAVLCAKTVIGDEPFAILLPDDLIDGKPAPCLQQMVAVYEKYGKGVVAVERVPKASTDKYGIVAVEPIEAQIAKIQTIVEKPKPEMAPSNLGVVGRYILPGRIMKLLEYVERGAGGEIQLTDGIAALLSDETVFAYEFSGKRYDCGSKFGWLQANVDFALQHADMKERFAAYLRETLSCTV